MKFEKWMLFGSMWRRKFEFGSLMLLEWASVWGSELWFGIQKGFWFDWML